MTRDEANRKLAEWVGYTFGDDGLCIEPSGHYNTPVPDFYTSEEASALLLDKMPEPELWLESSKGEIKLWGCKPDMDVENILAFSADRKQAIAEAALHFIAGYL